MNKKNIKIITILSLIIVALAAIASLTGLIWQGEGENIPYTSIRGEEVMIQGRGLYYYDTVSMATQAIAQDAVTFFIGIPLLIYSIILLKKGSIKGKLLLTGTVGYFLYTYASYAFLGAFNQLFLIYTAIFSLSLFTLILSFMSINVDTITFYFDIKTPIKSTAIFLFFTAGMLALMWVGRIAPSFTEGGIPYGLEIYSTLTIQAFDLGLIIPLSVLSGVLLLKKKPWGYLLTSIFLLKTLTLSISVSTMAIFQIINGITVSIVEISIFLLITLLIVFITWRFVRCIKPYRIEN